MVVILSGKMVHCRQHFYRYFRAAAAASSLNTLKSQRTIT